jgi:hypothetical protein
LTIQISHVTIGANLAAQAPPRPGSHDPHHRPAARPPARIVALGREGLGAAEIAAALGLGVRELEAMARGDPAVELALDRAEAAAMACAPIGSSPSEPIRAKCWW